LEPALKNIELERMFKTTVQLPLGDRQVGAFTIQVPMGAFLDSNEREAHVAEFNSKITIAVLKIVRETTDAANAARSTESSPPKPTIPAPSKSAEPTPVKTDIPNLNIQFHYWDGQLRWFKIKRTQPLQRVLEAFAEILGLPPTAVRMDYAGIRLHGDETPEVVSEPELDGGIGLITISLAWRTKIR
jgi:hypothetical protein